MLAGAVVIALAVSAFGSRWAIAHAHRNALLDLPGERRSHVEPTPRGGGIGIVIAGLLALLTAGIGGSASHDGWWVAAGLLLVAGIGWWDDHRPLPAWPRLSVHAIAAACLAWAIHMQGASTPAVVAAFVLAVVLINAWNFMDGIDGLAASQALLCALGFAVVLGDAWRVLALVVAGACLGFLPFNFPKARVFLGDVGSGALGYLIATQLAAGVASHPLEAWPVLLLPPMAMLVDSGLTLLWRMRGGERWWQAHVQHVFQRCSRRHGHIPVTAAFAGWTFAATAIMLVALHLPPRSASGLALTLLLVSVWSWRWLHRRYRKDKTEGFGA